MQTILIDEELGKKATKVFEKMGLNLSEFIESVLNEIVNVSEDREKKWNDFLELRDRNITPEEPWYKDEDELVKYIKEEIRPTVLEKACAGFKNAAFEAGFNDEAEFQDYAKNVIRKEIFEERYGKSND